MSTRHDSISHEQYQAGARLLVNTSPAHCMAHYCAITILEWSPSKRYVRVLYDSEHEVWLSALHPDFTVVEALDSQPKKEGK